MLNIGSEYKVCKDSYLKAMETTRLFDQSCIFYDLSNKVFYSGK